MKSEGKDALPSKFGRYTLVERLATGGMAEVFKAKILSNHGFEKLLVIKRILPHLAKDKTFVSMFIDEAKLTAQLVHPKIVQVSDFGEVEGQYFIALEFVDGFDALALLRTSAQRQVRLPLPISVFITMEVLDALDYAHNAKDQEGRSMRLVHRDISPSNVFISRRGDVKLGDFGIAHARERESKTQAGTLKGKYGYMSPEQVVGGQLDGRSDLFAVGIVLAETLMGRRLFTAPTDLDVLLMVRDGRLDRLDKYCRDVPLELDRVVRKALKKRPADRYQTAAAFRDDLADLLFRHKLRVGASDVGVIAADYFDTSPEALLRLREHGRKWEMKAVTQPLDPPTGPGQSASHSAVTTGLSTNSQVHTAELARAALPLAGKGAQASHAAAADANAAEDPLEVVIDDDLVETPAAAPSPVPGKRTMTPVVVPSEAHVAAYNQALEQPRVVGLDQYAAANNHTPPPVNAFTDYLTPVVASPRLGSGPVRNPTGERPAVVPPPGPGFSASPGSRPPDSAGDLAIISPMRVFADLAVAGETGLLRFEIAPHIKEVYLVRGAPESVNSSLSAERFGEYLVARGFIKASDLEASLAQLPRFSGKLGDTLVGLGIMRPLDVFRLLSQQVRERVMEIFGWVQGYFSFYRGARNATEAFPLGLDTFEILGAGVLTLPYEFLERKFLPFVEYRPRSKAYLRIAPEAFRLGPTPREVCGFLDGTRTLREWMARFTQPQELLTFLRTLYLLVEADLAQFE